MEVGPLTADDAAMMAALHERSFDRPWKAWEIRRVMASSTVYAFGAWDVNAVFVGFVVARTLGGEDAEILTLAVGEGARQRGVGRALTRAAANEAGERGCERLVLEVAVDNQAALLLYAGLGFDKVGYRKGYYARPSTERVDGLVLALPLTAA